MHARAEAIAQPFLRAGLQRVIDRRRSVGAQAHNGSRSIHTTAISIRTGERRHASGRRQRVEASRIAVEGLEQRRSLRANVTETENNVRSELTLHLKTEALIVRRAEIFAHDRSRELVWIDARILYVRQTRERIRH